MEERNKLALGIVLVTAFLILFLRLGAYPLLDPDEARFARTSVEMTRSGDYVVPSFEGAPRLQKPPLLHWVQAGLFRIAGPNEFLARLPSAGSTFVSLLLVAWVGWRRFGDEGAAWSAAFFATFPLVVGVARIGTLDALLSVHLLAVLALDMVQPEQSGMQRSAVIGALLGLAFLVKGPPGVALALVMMLSGRTATGRDVLPSVKTTVTATLAWGAVVLPWGLAFAERIGWSNVGRLIQTETVERAVAGTSHVQPAWYYLEVSLVAFLPWAGPLLLGTVRGLARWRDRDSPTGPYAAAALVGGLVFFSASKGKLPNYILPLAPFAALVVAFELGQELVHPRRRRAGPILVATTLVALSVGLGVAAAIGLEDRARGLAASGAVLYGLAALGALYGMLKSAPRVVYAFAAAASAFFLVAVAAVSPALLAATRSAKPLVDLVPQLTSARPVIVLDMNLPSLTYYADRVPEKMSGVALGARLDRGDDPLVVLDAVDLPSIPPGTRARLREIARYGKFRILERSDARKSGESPPIIP